MQGRPLPLNIHATFLPGSDNAGTVLIQVQTYDFWVHRDLLIFASSFFESLLCGGWRETQSDASTASPRNSMLCSSNTIDRTAQETSMAVLDAQTDNDVEEPNRDGYVDSSPLPSPTIAIHEVNLQEVAPVSDFGEMNPPVTTRPHSRTSLQPRNDREAFTSRMNHVQNFSDTSTIASSNISFAQQVENAGIEFEDRPAQLIQVPRKVDARIRLQEEKAAAFQDLLFFVYPHLELQCTWYNVEDLMSMSRKFDMPLLAKQCVAFLLSSAAGRSISALRIAEEFDLPDVYKEASRFVLDNFSNWEAAELVTLSEKTQLKLEKKRSWFYERLLRLGLVNFVRDYTCCLSCPAPDVCAKALEEKWRSAWAATFRYGGSPSPSLVYRSLRMLEPSLASPALHLQNTACQATAKLHVSELFDRLFGMSSGASRNSFGRSFSSVNPTRLGENAVKQGAKYFLSCELHDSGPPKRSNTPYAYA